MESRITAKPAAPEPAKQVATLKGPSDGVAVITFSPDRSLLAMAGRNGSGRIWDIGGAARERCSFAGDTRFQSFAFAPNGRTLAAGSGAEDGRVRLLDISDKQPREIASLRGAKGAINCVAISPDSKLVAAGGEDRTLRVWEPASSFRNEPRTQLPGHTGPIRALAIALDNQGVATASQDHTVRVWAIGRIRSWERVVLQHPHEVYGVAWSPNGRTVATACEDRKIRIWDPNALKPKPMAEFGADVGRVRCLVFTADSLVTVSDGLRIIHWDPQNSRPLREWEATGEVLSVALTPDGRYLATGKADGTVGVYRVAEKRV
jgi:WD40 repeat protein